MKRFKLLSISLILLITACEKSSNESNIINIFDKPISEQVNNSINEAELTYKKISDFRDAIFQDAISQAYSILCSAERIKDLKDNNLTDNQFIKKIKNIFMKQSFIQYKYLKTEKKYYEYLPVQKRIQKYFFFRMSIKNARQYTNPTFDVRIHELNLCILYQKKYPKDYIGKICDNCGDYYNRPIPNSNEAKKIEIINFARMIAIAIRRLKMHEERLPILEIQLSTILSFESTLKKMRQDFAFDMLDPINTEAKIKKYDTFFDNSLKSLNEFKKGLTTDIEVEIREVSEIERIL